MRRRHVIASNLLAAILLVEIPSSLFLKERLRELYPHYLDTGARFSPFPRHYFQQDSEIGFDIRKDSPPTPTSNTPPEAGEYMIFSNAHGCFDKRKDYSSKSLIYVAGDSFTWGYAPYKNKFATLLEQRINTPIAKCGVTGTGQVHQFEKFSRLHRKGEVDPQLVMVNIFANDIEDDFLHPINTVLDGWSVRNARLIEDSSGLRRTEYSEEENKDRYQKWKERMLYNPKRYSATAILTIEAIKRLYSIRDQAKEVTELKEEYNALSFKHYGERPSLSNFRALLKWEKHAQAHGYRVLFFLIPPRDAAPGFYSEFTTFAKERGLTTYDFQSYIQDKGINQSTLYYLSDGHFNNQGNLAYLEYILKVITETMNQDRLYRSDA